MPDTTIFAAVRRRMVLCGWTTTSVLCALGLLSASAGAATGLDCSKPLTRSITLTSDAYCSGNLQAGALLIGANHVTINLNGYGLSGGYAGAIRSNGHSDILIENGYVDAVGSAVQLDNSHLSTIRNVQASSDPGIPPVLLRGGSSNHVVGTTTTTFPGQGITLSGEHGDMIANDRLQSTLGAEGGTLTLNDCSADTIARNAMSEITFQASDRNVVVGNTVSSPYPSVSPGGMMGDGNYNLIAHNVTGIAGITLTGTGNVLVDNTIAP